jgi:hypothetical protein
MAPGMTNPSPPSIKNASKSHQPRRSQSVRRYDKKCWNAIYREYRAGQLTLCEISLRFGPASCTIIERAKRRGWGERDLSHKVREGVRAKLTADALLEEDVDGKLIRPVEAGAAVRRGDVLLAGDQPGEEPALKGQPKSKYSDRSRNAEGAREDTAIIEAAAERGAEVVRRHRLHLRELHEVATGLLAKLKAVLAGKEQGFEVPVIQFGKATGEKRITFPFLGQNESLTDALAKVSQATARFIPLERQAFNLDDRDSEDRDRVRLEDRLKQYAKEEQATVEKVADQGGPKVVPFKPRPMDDMG